VLERALVEGEVRAAIPARAARYVASERSERRHAKDRLGFYLSVAAHMGFDIKGRQRAAFPPPETRDERHAAMTFPDSNYQMLGAGEVERLLEEGLRHKHAGNVADARRSFLAAARLAPRSHLPPLLLGGVEAPAAAIEALTRAESLNPTSCQAAYLRGVRLLEVGDVADAAAACARARSRPATGRPRNVWACSPRRRAAPRTLAGSSRRRPCRTRASRCRSRGWPRSPSAAARSTRRSACWNGSSPTIPTCR